MIDDLTENKQEEDEDQALELKGSYETKRT